MRPLRFPRLQHAEFENIRAAATDISSFAEAHKRTVEEINFEGMELTSGTWDEALAPLTKLSRSRLSEDAADIPIMLSPTLPAPMQRVEVAHHETANGRKSLRLSRWLSARSKGKPALARKPKEGLLGYEGQLRKVLRGSMFPWRNAQ
jgi:hypothetical protein